MAIFTPSIYINDDEVDFKLIFVYSTKFKKQRKYTISEAERLGLIKIETGSFLLGNLKYSKVIKISNSRIKLCLSTRATIT
jgi:hypothetical protein